MLALLGHDEAGRQTLDAPILIRTAEITPDGDAAGAGRRDPGPALHPAGEVAETHTKAAGILAALGLRAGRTARRPTGRDDRVARPDADRPTPVRPVRARLVRLADDSRVRAVLAARNDHLARFWLDDGIPGGRAGAGRRRALIVDGEDTFTGMLAHQLRALGLAVTVLPYRTAGGGDAPTRHVRPGRARPGTGRPACPDDPKMAALRGIDRSAAGRRPADARRSASATRCWPGCSGCGCTAGEAPYQGLQREVDLFGTPRRVGFYSTFTAVAPPPPTGRADTASRAGAAGRVGAAGRADRLRTAFGEVELACDPVDGAVHALRGPTFAGVQFHPESVLSKDGLTILRDLIGVLIPVNQAEVAPEEGHIAH